MENLILLADTMQQAAALLADEDIEEAKSQSPPTFLNVVAVGHISAGKSAVMNSLIGYPVLPTGENGATRAPIIVEMKRDESGNRKGLAVQVEGGRLQSVSASDLRHNLQGRLSKWVPNAKGRPDEIKLRLVSSAAPPLKLIDLPGMEARAPIEDSIVRDYAEHNDTVLLLVIPAAQAANILGARALKLVQDLDSEGSRTVGVISKVDQAASDPRSLAAVQALLSGQGPSSTAEFPWVALIGQSVSIAAAHSGSGTEDSLETAWRAEAESLKQILPQASSTKLGRIALVDTLSSQIRKRLKIRLPSLLSGLEGKSQVVEEELVRLGEMRVETSEGTRAIALELCREFDDKFLETIASGETGGWKVVASFEGTLPNRFKQLPLSELFDMNSIKRLVLEADGYQPYLLSPEKGLRALVRKALEFAKDPAKSCVDEVHRILVDIVSAAASATPGLGRYPPLKREIVAIASAALEEYRVEARKMVIALVDMERSFIPPQHFIRLVQRRMEKLRKDDELRGRATKRAQDSEVALLNKATAPQPSNSGGGGILKSLKGQKEDKDKEAPEPVSTLQTAGPNNEIVAGYLSKKSAKTNQWVKRWFVLNEKTAKFSYTKKPEEKHFRGVINLEECVIEDASDSDMEDGAPEPTSKKSSKDKKNANGDANKISASALAFKISNKVAYKTVLKAHHNIVLKAENMADKLDWMSRLRKCIGGGTTPTKESDNSSSKKGTTLKTSSSAPSLTESTSSRSTSDGPVEPTNQRRPIDPEEDLRMMAQEVRDYVEAVLNSLAANVPKAVVLCQVERSKDAMLAQLYSSISAHPTPKIEELLKEDHEVKKRRERCQRQASLLSKLTKQLSVHEARAAAVSGFLDNSSSSNGLNESPKAQETEDWRLAFDQAANTPPSHSHSRSPRPSSRGPGMNGEISGRHSDNDENGDVGNQSRRTPSRLPPPPPGSSQPVYRY